MAEHHHCYRHVVILTYLLMPRNECDDDDDDDGGGACCLFWSLFNLSPLSSLRCFRFIDNKRQHSTGQVRNQNHNLYTAKDTPLADCVFCVLCFELYLLALSVKWRGAFLCESGKMFSSISLGPTWLVWLHTTACWCQEAGGGPYVCLSIRISVCFKFISV